MGLLFLLTSKFIQRKVLALNDLNAFAIHLDRVSSSQSLCIVEVLVAILEWVKLD